MEANLKVLLAQADDLKSQIDRLRPMSPEQENRIFAKYRLDWNYHSNAIEGNALTFGETATFLREGLTANGKPIKDHLDMRGHDTVINFLLHLVRGKSVITEADIREMHKLLLGERYKAIAKTPEGGITEKWIDLGRYKTQPNEVETVTGEIRRFALPEETPARMEKLINWFRTTGGREHPVVTAAQFHHEFVAIHPFDDGNGRMARLLMNLILMQGGFPPAVIKISERDRYIAALVSADVGDLLPITTFIAEKVIASLDIFLKGARGEDIDESDDIDKKIALLRLELSSVPDPKVLSPEVYREFLDQVLEPLLGKLVKKIGPLVDFFVSSKMFLSPSFENPTLGGYLSLLEMLRKQAKINEHINVGIILENFKKAGVESFSIALGFQIELNRTYFRIDWLGQQVKGLYGQNVESSIIMVANGLAKSLFDQIQERRLKGVSNSGMIQ